MGETFPRTADLPAQSPLFWVDQKDRYLRQLLIRDIEAITSRRLVVYHANRFAGAQIDQRDVGFLRELWSDVGAAPVDLLLETSGGYTDATEAVIALLQTLSSDFRVIVPSAAKSNGTMISLAGRSIVMGAGSELGPVEPQLNGIPCTILAQEDFKSQNYILHHFAIDALKQTKGLTKVLLSSGMLQGKPEAEIENVVASLCTRDKYFSHGSVIDHREAKQLGLAIEYLAPDSEVWQRLWLLYCMYDFDSRRSSYLKVFEGNSRSAAIAIPLPTAAVAG